MISTVSLLKTEMEDAWDLLVRTVAGIDDKILHWEPAPGSWGLLLKDGRWKIDDHLPNPLPPGPKTIGWPLTWPRARRCILNMPLEKREESGRI
jgi:hypothetical protein